MSRETTFEISVLNITTQPHSPENYVALFERAFSVKPAISPKYHGSDHISLKVTEKDTDKDGNVTFIFGYVQKYTVIESDSWYDRTKDAKVNDEEKPDYDLRRFSPNHVGFEFVFLPYGHRMFVITKYKIHTLSIARLAKAIENIFATNFMQKEFNKIIVSVEHDEASIEKMMSMDELEKIFIRVSLDNDDDKSDMKSKLLSSLRHQNAQTASRQLIGEKGKSLKPDEETKAMMELSLSNGYTIATGKRSGEKAVEKSSSYPVIIPCKILKKTETLRDNIISTALSYIEYFKTRQRK